MYWYVHNLQGDIVAIVDTTGPKVIEYKYDAWGNPVDAGTIPAAYQELARLNPFRYRGYVWDDETKLYYLRSRYYSPEWGRFICADNIIVSSEAVIGSNVFCYCINNPINQQDQNGLSPSFSAVMKGVAITALVIAELAIAVAVAPVIVVGGASIAAGSALTVAGVAVGTAIVATGAGIVYDSIKKKPVNLPSYKRIKLDMDHIMSGHGYNGNRGPNKDKFPPWVNPYIAEKIIRHAYRYGEKIKSQGDRVMIHGPWYKNNIIEMWVNTKTMIIESAWPK